MRKILPILSNKYLVILFILLTILTFSSFNYIGYNKTAICFNYISGDIYLNDSKGILFSTPWTLVTVIDLKPVRVCIDCSCKNMTCKLVKFNPNGYKELVKREGWSYYWWRNRISYNMGNRSEYRGFNNILRGYSFDDDDVYEFIDIIN